MLPRFMKTIITRFFQIIERKAAKCNKLQMQEARTKLPVEDNGGSGVIGSSRACVLYLHEGKKERGGKASGDLWVFFFQNKQTNK